MAEAIVAPQREHPIVDQNGVSSLIMFQWMTLLSALLAQGFTGTVTTAKLTGGGVNGSMTFVNGVLISQVQAT